MINLPDELWSRILVKAVYVFGDWGDMSEEEVKNAIDDILKTIFETLESLPGKIYEIGKNIVKGLIDGIKSATGWLFEQQAKWCDEFVMSFKDSFGIRSPSKVFKEQVSKNLALGVGEGFKDEMKNVREQMEK